MLKEISQRSREDMEAFLGNRVYLELWVKVRPKWREKEGGPETAGAGRRPSPILTGRREKVYNLSDIPPPEKPAK